MKRIAGRSLDFPVSFTVRGTQSAVTATLLQFALGGCRIRTWCILPVSETLRIDLPRGNGEILQIHGKVRASLQLSITSYEHLIELDPLTGAQADLLAREAALLVQRRHTAA